MAYNVIWVGPADGANHKPLTIEGTAGGAILPGSLAAVDGNAITSSTADGTKQADLVIAREIGEQYGASVTTQWATGNNVICVRPRSGEFFNVVVEAGQTITRGTALTANGGGQFKAAGASDVHLCYSAVDATGLPANSLVLATV